jgi:hypothetical protein
MAASFAGLGFVHDYAWVMLLSVGTGVFQGLQSSIPALMAASLTGGGSGRDMNLLQTAVTATQIGVPPVCGYVLDAFAHSAADGSAASGSGGGLEAMSGNGAYLWIWTVSGALQLAALPFLAAIPDRGGPEGLLVGSERHLGDIGNLGPGDQDRVQ